MNRSAPRAPYAGLFCLTLAALLHELLLTRIFSVAMWYHFAFMAISIAMFGATLGALIVYLRPALFPVERAHERLAAGALGYALLGVLSLVLFLQIPIPEEASWTQAGALAVSYVLIAIPFVLSGITVTVALTRFPEKVGRLYAADLIGAAIGCVALVYLLDWTDAPSAILVVGAAGALAAWLFVRRQPGMLRTASGVAALLLAATAVGHSVLAAQGSPLLKVRYARGQEEGSHLYLRWNSFSRVHVDGNPERKYEPTGWGLSPRTPKKPKIPQLYMGIDVVAGTPIIGFDGDLDKMGFLQFDVTNVAHHLRRNADVAVIGVGGGRDVLSALAFGQRSVLGVEINENVLRATNQTFGEFSGHLDQNPRVTMVVDEARSYLARTEQRFDIIQISLIDTWAATAAGAFVLAESSLYTAEAWETLAGRLTPTGILSVSRWYLNDRPAEFHRVTSLGREALRRLGVEDARAHMLIVKVPSAPGLAGQLGNGVGTLLLSPSPFTRTDIATLEKVVRQLGFEIVLSPDTAEDAVYEKLLEKGTDLDALYAELPLDVSPPTDDRPFFFQMLRPRDILSPPPASTGIDFNRANLAAVRTLGALLAIVLVLTASCIIAPLALTADRKALRGSGPFLLYFAAIGFGFMFVEISQMQRLMVFLGHPTYALSVVLFTLLLAGGMGSALSERWTDNADMRRSVPVLGTLVVVLLVSGLLTPALLARLGAATTPLRIGVAVGLLTPMGLVMGMAFPLGMRAASRRASSLTPWLWGINGATSVCCSVLTIAVSLAWGISASFWAGLVCYGVALLAYLSLARAAATSAEGA